jgi:MFS family permease
MTGFRGITRALYARNFRLFVAGQGFSLIGTWMQQVAMSWLVYRLSGSAMLLGVTGFLNQIPSLLFTPLAGVLADRCDRRRLLIMTQCLAMIQAAILAAVVLTGVVQIWHVLLLSAVLGIINAFDIPIRQSFVVEMVDQREDLGNAIALNASLFNGARLVGPSIAGIVVAVFGEGVCFLINSLSFCGVLAALMAMRLAPRPHRVEQRHVLHELREGISYSFGFSPIRKILMLVALVALTGMSYAVLMPVFAREVLHGDSRTFGFLMASAGSGAFLSTLFLASRKSVLGLGNIISRSVFLFGFGIAVFAFSTSLPLSCCTLVLVGFGGTAMMASCNTILQTIVEEDKRGRVMSFFSVAFSGMLPFGSLLAGLLAGYIGPRQTLLLGSLGCFSGALLFARHLPKIREHVRPIYVRLGIVSENTLD